MKHLTNSRNMMRLFLPAILVLGSVMSSAQEAYKQPHIRLVNVSEGWAGNSVNAVVFRKNSVVSWRDLQFIAFYDQDQQVVLGKRTLGSNQWELKYTGLKGRATDAHNSISIMVDGDGYLHLSWDHHNNVLHYAKSLQPRTLELGAGQPMTGIKEQSVSYPEFFRMPDGDILFMYRNGESGRGDLVINRYMLKEKSWRQLHSGLISGEGKRNAYWQACVDKKGTIHISWVWRESPDVASNHDLCYARSKDGGITWENSRGNPYTLPITASGAEYAFRIPQNSELINQTSMAADERGRPYIATYWREAGDSIPDYHIVCLDAKNRWTSTRLDFRRTAFSLSGAGTKSIPISRPQIALAGAGKRARLVMLFRDRERGSRASAIVVQQLRKKRWKLIDLSSGSLGAWEPSFDTELWKEKYILHLFIQKVEQADAEGLVQAKPQMVSVLEWKPEW
ncbi:BNR repeat-containing protein [Flavihumibacter stibioxidans]|nr:BNR repeat-containing protein [Flavihumibacter stibioxidans]